MYVRHPFSRLVSLYEQIALKKNAALKIPVRFRNKLKARSRKKSRPEFRDFVVVLLEETDRDSFWLTMPIWARCRVCEVR